MVTIEDKVTLSSPTKGGTARMRWIVWFSLVAIVVTTVWVYVSPRLAGLMGCAALSVTGIAGSVSSRVFRKRVLIGLTVGLPLVAAAIGVRTWERYRTSDVMEIPVREFSNAEYPEDPAGKSVWSGMYQGRRLRLIRKDQGHFDFVFDPLHPHIATVTFEDVDVRLMTPSLPRWTKDDAGLRRIALTDRQWNRQQVAFGSPADGRVKVSGGDGTEVAHLSSAALAKNCLNAGLWEVLLFVNEDGQKKLYYQGWFTFPLGFYKEIFENNTGLPYANHWYYLEHWFDPAGTPIALNTLRKVIHESEAPTEFDLDEPLLIAGDQVRKRRTTMAANVVTWGDFYRPNDVRFAAFVPPGRYSNATPWSNEYQRIAVFKGTALRKVRSPASDETLDELEFTFANRENSAKLRFLVSGFKIDKLPQVPMAEYPKGLYMPMGIGVPPFYQDYSALQQHPPDQSPYFSVLLDEQDCWVDHHHFAIDGPVMHRDADNPGKLHFYLLSYERHSLIGHWIVSLPSSQSD